MKLTATSTGSRPKKARSGRRTSTSGGRRSTTTRRECPSCATSGSYARSTTHSLASSSSTARARHRGSSSVHWGDDEPQLGRRHPIPVWIRDEWNVTEAKVKEAAAAAAATTARSCSCLLPRVRRRGHPRHARQLRGRAGHDRPAARAADRRGPSGESRGCSRGSLDGERRLRSSSRTSSPARASSRAGGNELTTSSLRDGVETAGRHALARLFPKFGVADNPNGARSSPRHATGLRMRSPQSAGREMFRRIPSARRCSIAISGAGTKAPTSSDSSQTRRTAGRRTPSTVRCSPCSRNGNIRAERTGSPVGGPRSSRPPRSARRRSSKRTIRQVRRSAWRCEVCLPTRAFPTPSDRRRPRSAGSCSTSSTSPLVQAVRRRFPSRRRQPRRGAPGARGQPAVPRGRDPS